LLLDIGDLPLALNLDNYTGFPGPEIDRVVARPSP